jgi:uncharacterized protein (TIGR03083 family)
MDDLDHLACLRRELTAFAACLRGDLAVPIAHCGAWTLYDLVDHLGRGNLWAAAAVTEQRGDHQAAPAPREPVELAPWFDRTCTVLLTALDTDPAGPAWTFAPPHTVGFWHRRRALETLIHRWDAEHALGTGSDLDPALAGDGIAEVIQIMVPRQVHRGRASPPRHAVALSATDLDQSWTLGPGDPVATVRATAADLLLLLWGRLPHDHPAVGWHGDRDTARQTLTGPLVP